jgi:hypothetical protein
MKKTALSNRRGTFSPEHRELHNCSSAADGDEGLRAGDFDGEEPAFVPATFFSARTMRG